MDVGPSLVANAQPAKLVQPCQRSLNHPSMDAQPASMLCGALGKDWPNPKQTQRPPAQNHKRGFPELGLAYDVGVLACHELGE